MSKPKDLSRKKKSGASGCKHLYDCDCCLPLFYQMVLVVPHFHLESKCQLFGLFHSAVFTMHFSPLNQNSSSEKKNELAN